MGTLMEKAIQRSSAFPLHLVSCETFTKKWHKVPAPHAHLEHCPSPPPQPAGRGREVRERSLLLVWCSRHVVLGSCLHSHPKVCSFSCAVLLWGCGASAPVGPQTLHGFMTALWQACPGAGPSGLAPFSITLLQKLAGYKRGVKEILRVMEMFCILLWMVVTWVKSQLAESTVNFTVYWAYLNF